MQILGTPAKKTIKTIQRGTMTMTSTGTSVTISAVDRTKAIIKAWVRINSDVSASPKRLLVKVNFFSDTIIQFEIGDSILNTFVEWEVIEFNNVKSIQRGLTSAISGSNNITIASVEINKATLFVSTKSDSTVSNNSSTMVSGAKLTTSTNINIYLYALGWVEYQVIEFK